MFHERSSCTATCFGSEGTVLGHQPESLYRVSKFLTKSFSRILKAMGVQPPHFYDFGPYRVDPTQRSLLRNGIEVPLTPKAFDTLLFLVRNHGRVVEKDELLKCVWPDAFVEEATLAQNIFTLRKALNQGLSDDSAFIQTVPKRGYRFSAVVTEVIDEDVNADKAEQRNSADTTPSTAQAIRSLAILPMINATGEPDLEYLSDGITESIVNSLSLLPELHVKACSTVARFKGRDIDAQGAGAELGVEGIVSARIVSFRKRLIVRVELVDVTSGRQLWGEEYNERLADILKLQEKIAKNILEKLRLKLLGTNAERLLKPRTENAEAYQSYLKGRYFLNKRSKDGYTKAIQAFKHAIDLDPEYSQAYCGLADSYLLFDFYGLVPPWQTIPVARAAVVRALEIDSELAEAHSSSGAIKLIYDRDPLGAKREFERAIKLNPRDAHAHNGYAHCLMELGNVSESLAECRLALELEPFDLRINLHLGWHYLLAREYDHAIEQVNHTLEMGPDFYRARLLLGIAYGQSGSFSKAIAEFQRASELEQTSVLRGFLGYAYARDGRIDEAKHLLNELLKTSKESYVPPYCIALIYMGLGKRSKAIEWLKKAFVDHDHGQHWLNLTPEFDELRSDTGFIQFLQSAGFDQPQY